jgi:hypothetical protein
MKQLVLAGLVAALAPACANSSTAQEGKPPLETTVRLQSPLKVSWEEQSVSATQAVVLAKVERVTKLDMPFLMSVELPAGVKVLEGRTQLQLLPNTEAVTVTERLVLGYEGTPLEDAQLKLDGDAASMGFHYKVPYRFGRPAPDESGPKATGPEFIKAGKSLGPSIPLK